MQKFTEAVILKDHKLEEKAEGANQELYKHRWHWTIDESNPHRVSFSTYAKAVGRSPQNISTQARGYEAWLEDQSLSLNEHSKRAGMSQEKRAAVDAIALLYGISGHSVIDRYGKQVRQLRERAQERAEKNGTEVIDEIKALANLSIRGAEARVKDRDQMKKAPGLRFAHIDDLLIRARKSFLQALNESHNVPWTEEELELLNDSVSKTRALLDLLSVSLQGQVEVDWDAELAKLQVG